jgi:hypothetical protein
VYSCTEAYDLRSSTQGYNPTRGIISGWLLHVPSHALPPAI